MFLVEWMGKENTVAGEMAINTLKILDKISLPVLNGMSISSLRTAKLCS